MTDALPYRSGKSGIPLFEPVELGRLKPSTIWLALSLTLLFGLCLRAAMDYEVRHPMAMPWARGSVREPQAPGRAVSQVLFRCTLENGSRLRVEAEVKQAEDLPAPSGEVRFLVGYETLKFVKMENGAAVATVHLQKSQLHATFRALYLGDERYAPSFSNVGTASGR